MHATHGKYRVRLLSYYCWPSASAAVTRWDDGLCYYYFSRRRLLYTLIISLFIVKRADTARHAMLTSHLRRIITYIHASRRGVPCHFFDYFTMTCLFDAISISRQAI